MVLVDIPSIHVAFEIPFSGLLLNLVHDCACVEALNVK